MQSRSSVFSPTRLLSVGSTGDSTVRLVTSKSHPNEAYVTLSYCWGSGNPVTLLSRLVADFQRGIPLASLPRTLREAVEATRELQFKYIWIDALCIIQDSEEDWNQEASKMADIYNNSYCTIAATSSKDCDGGLARSRSPDALKILHVKTNWKGTENGTRILVDRHVFMRDVDKAPLNSRGWVLQERYLSPRTIHFGRTQLFWECYQLSACEEYPDGIQPGCSTGLAKHDFSPRGDSLALTTRLGRPGRVNYPNDVFQYWETLVGTFTSSKLTKYEDKLPAISGLARRFADIISDEYVVGLWKSRLATQLVWIAMKPGPRLKTYIAPSWSWVSIDGEVSRSGGWGGVDAPVTIIHIRDIGYTIKLETEDKFGRVKSAALQFFGRLYPAVLKPRAADREDDEEPLYRNFWTMDFDDEDLNRDDIDARLASFDTDPEPEDKRVYCVPILSYRATDLHCLLLQATGHAKGEYRRVGHSSIFPGDLLLFSILDGKTKRYHMNFRLYNEQGMITVV